jgi:hypothetical protein
MLVLFPQVVAFMATNLDWTTAVGQAFTADRAAVMESVQRLRADAMKAGKLKSSPQQSVSIMKTDSGHDVIVIEPVKGVVSASGIDSDKSYCSPLTIAARWVATSSGTPEAGVMVCAIDGVAISRRKTAR